MLNGYKQSVLNMHGLKSLLKAPDMPNENLAIGGDDMMCSVPLLIFCNQQPPMPTPLVDNIANSSYEKQGITGDGVAVEIGNFVTDDFDLGAAMAGY